LDYSKSADLVPEGNKMHAACRIGLMLALIIGLGVRAAQAQTGPDDAYRLLAASRLAMGGGVWEGVHLLHERMTVEAGGLVGTLDDWADPAHGRFVEHYTLGPDRGAAGWDGHAAWNADWAGRVHGTDGKSAAAMRTSALWQSFAYLLPGHRQFVATALGRRFDAEGRGFDVVRLAPDGGGSVEMWLDAKTALPGRVVVKGRSGPDLVLKFDDYREMRGLKLPGTIRASTGLVRYDHLSRLNDIEIDPPVDVDPFAPPSPPPADYRFEDGGTRSTMSLFTTGDAFMVDVMIDGKGPYRFALDTGAGDAIDTGLAAELGLSVGGTLSAEGAGELPVDIGLTRAARVEIGDVTLDDQLLRVLPLSQIVAGDHPPYRGLLGYEFFDRFVVSLEPDRNRVVISEPTGWAYRGDGKPVPFVFHGRIPAVDGQIDLVPGRFTLDTGQANSLTLYRPFIRRAGIERKYVPKLTAIVGEGVGGPIRAEVARGQKLMMGATQVNNPVLFLSRQQSGAFSDPDLAGNVGGGVFQRFNTTFDYARRLVYFEPIANFGQDDSLKLMVVKRGLIGLEVLSVLPGGPLAEAGLKRDDIIEAIDSHEALRIDDPQLQRIFRRPAGTKVLLTVRSKGELKHITVVLGELV
jgi:hypothetical protein